MNYIHYSKATESSTTSQESNEHSDEYYDTDDDNNNSLGMELKILTDKHLTDTTSQFEILGVDSAVGK
jgi:hypothetical protein